METASLTIETEPPANEEKDMIEMLINYMKQVEKYKSKTISGKEKKLYVKKQLKNIFKKTYDDYEPMIDAMIDMICYIAKHKDMLHGINRSGLMKMKCCTIF
jgi:ferritin